MRYIVLEPGVKDVYVRVILGFKFSLVRFVVRGTINFFLLRKLPSISSTTSQLFFFFDARVRFPRKVGKKRRARYAGTDVGAKGLVTVKKKRQSATMWQKTSYLIIPPRNKIFWLVMDSEETTQPIFAHSFSSKGQFAKKASKRGILSGTYTFRVGT
jgi:hypothetical protein